MATPEDNGRRTPSSEIIIERLTRLQRDVNDGFSKLERQQERTDERLESLESDRAVAKAVAEQLKSDNRTQAGYSMQAPADQPESTGPAGKLLNYAILLLGAALALIAAITSQGGGTP